MSFFFTFTGLPTGLVAVTAFPSALVFYITNSYDVASCLCAVTFISFLNG